MLAIDVGGTTIKAARIDQDGRTQAEITIPTGIGREAIDKIISICAELRDRTTLAATVAVPGILDEGTGFIHKSVNLRWNSVPLADLIAARVSLPTTVVHDVRAACSAEMQIGVGKTQSNFLVVVIGTGLAAGIVVGGALISGATQSAGEIGHMVVRPNGENCVCGRLGCAEVYSSAGGISRRYAAFGGSAALSVADIAASTDPRAKQVWKEATSLLGLALANVVVTLDPSVIVLAGGLSRAGDALLVPVRRALSSEMTWRAAPMLSISALTSRAGLAGAAIEAWRGAGVPDVASAWSSSLAATALQ